jgi:hypothetical protein
MPLATRRNRRGGNLLDKPVIGSINERTSKEIEHIQLLSSPSNEEAKSDFQAGQIPSVVENFYTDRLLGNPINNYDLSEPTKDDLKKLEWDVKNELIRLNKVAK